MPVYNCLTEGQLSFGLTDLNCTGNEDHLLNCSRSNAVLQNCQSYGDASVVCQSMLSFSNTILYYHMKGALSRLTVQLGK